MLDVIATSCAQDGRLPHDREVAHGVATSGDVIGVHNGGVSGGAASVIVDLGLQHALGGVAHGRQTHGGHADAQASGSGDGAARCTFRKRLRVKTSAASPAPTSSPTLRAAGFNHELKPS
jgi:hypothetical protein